MSATDTQIIQDIVTEVLNKLNAPGSAPENVVAPAPAPTPAVRSSNGDGLFADVDQAVLAATAAQEKLARAGMEARDGICKLIKKIAAENADAWGRFELDETQVGRLDHKIAKLELLERVPGVEYLQAHATTAHSGDEGIALDEAAPFGVIGCITPVTHSIPTMTANAINMIASGNSMVVNPHPSGAKSAALAASVYNKAVQEAFGIGPLCCVIDPPTLESANAIFRHRGIPMLVVTGGPAVARAALKQPKRAIVAGPGNPPVVVDETADLDVAARSIIDGAAFDNNLLCIGEKEVFVVASVFDKMMDAMARVGAAGLDAGQVAKLTDAAFSWHKDHHVPNKDFVGKDASVLASAAGVNAGNTDLLFGETQESNPFVPTEQMMPFVPFVRVPNFDTALNLALKHEHGFGHTAIIHSNNLTNITRMGQEMKTTIFVANGPCTAGLGMGGEGYASYSIATPTGEGITTPLTFTRFRRNTIAQALRIV